MTDGKSQAIANRSETETGIVSRIKQVSKLRAGLIDEFRETAVEFLDGFAKIRLDDNHAIVEFRNVTSCEQPDAWFDVWQASCLSTTHPPSF